MKELEAAIEKQKEFMDKYHDDIYGETLDSFKIVVEAAEGYVIISSELLELADLVLKAAENQSKYAEGLEAWGNKVLIQHNPPPDTALASECKTCLDSQDDVFSMPPKSKGIKLVPVDDKEGEKE